MNPEYDRTLFLVHGVGETGEGEMEAAVKAGYRECKKRKHPSDFGSESKKVEFPNNVQILEAHWNTVVERVWRDGAVNAREFVNVAASVRQGLEVIRLIHSEGLSTGRKWTEKAFQSGDLLLFFGILLAAVLPLIGFILYALSWPVGWLFPGTRLPFELVALWKPEVIGGLGMLCASLILEAITTMASMFFGGKSAVLESISGGIAAAVLRLSALVFVVLVPFLIFGNWLFAMLRLQIWRRHAGWKFAIGCGLLTLLMVVDSKHFTTSAAIKGFAVVLVGGSYLLLCRFGAFVAKAFGDIFHYVSNSTYRDDIQGYMRGKFNEAGAHSGPIIIAAHSLGTVIALDFLSNTDQWKDRAVILITGGSPLARFFFRFFPGIFFFENAAACANALSKKFARFEWHNCYRGFDYIGQRIGLPKEPSFSEKRILRFFPWHMGYWADTKVHDWLGELLDPSRKALHEIRSVKSEVIKGASDTKVESTAIFVWLATFILLVCFTFWGRSTQYTKEYDRIVAVVKDEPASHRARILVEEVMVSMPDRPVIKALIPEIRSISISDGSESTPVATVRATGDIFASGAKLLADHSYLIQRVQTNGIKSGREWVLENEPVVKVSDSTRTNVYFSINAPPGRYEGMSILGFVGLGIYSFVVSLLVGLVVLHGGYLCSQYLTSHGGKKVSLERPQT